MCLWTEFGSQNILGKPGDSCYLEKKKKEKKKMAVWVLAGHDHSDLFLTGA